MIANVVENWASHLEWIKQYWKLNYPHRNRFGVDTDFVYFIDTKTAPVWVIYQTLRLFTLRQEKKLESPNKQTY